MEAIEEERRRILAEEDTDIYDRGCRVGWFSFNRSEVDGYYKGNCLAADKVQLRCNFFTRSVTSAANARRHLEEYEKISKLSRSIDCAHILTPLVVGKTESGNLVAIGYRFDQSFKHWYLLNGNPLFQEANGIMDEWCRHQIWNLLIAIMCMHSLDITHGNLGNIRSYVVFEDMMYIIMTEIDPNQFVKYSLRQRKQRDLKQFLVFLTTYFSQGRASYDWDYFCQLFPSEKECKIDTFSFDTRIKQLLNHPVLKDEEGRYDHALYWLDCCVPYRDKGNKVTKLVNDVAKNMPLRLTPWYGNLKKDDKSDYYHQFAKVPEEKKGGISVKKYFDSASDFVRYLRDLLKHLHLRPTKRTIQEIDRDLEKLFPGYLGYFHNQSCKHSEYLKIAEEYQV